MFEGLALWTAIFSFLAAVANWGTHRDLVEKIKLAEKARERREQETRRYEEMRREYEVARDSYDTRLETLKNAEAIAAILAGKGESNV